MADDRVRLYDLATGVLRATLKDLDGSVAAVAFSPDGRLLAIGDAEGGVRLLDVTSADGPRTLAAVPAAAAGATNELVFTPAGRLLVLTNARGSLLDIEDPARPRSLGSLPPGTIAASGTGALILTESQDDLELGLWTLSSSAGVSRVATLVPPSRALGTNARAAFSPNGHILAVGGSDNRVRLWDVADPTRPAVRSDLNAQGRDGISCVEFSSDGTVLALGGRDGVITLWDVSDPFRPHSGARLTGYPGFASVSGIAFGPDGQTLASIASDREQRTSARVWAVSGIDRTSTVTILPTEGTFPPRSAPTVGCWPPVAVRPPCGGWTTSRDRAWPPPWARSTPAVRPRPSAGTATPCSPVGPWSHGTRPTRRLRGW